MTRLGTSARHLLAGASFAALFVAPCAHAADPALIARGKYLAIAGDCIACHQAPGGKAFAGGLYMNTPFGEMATPNLTPDKETGIGNWTDDQFYRALHFGIRNDGAYLYPGLPYPWFTKVTKDDVLAIKAYLFSLPPVHAPQKPNHLIFPTNIRLAVAGWNALNFKPGEYKPDASQSAQWNRGAYLVEGLGHCADCHTPKNISQAPVADEAFAGGKLDNWYAPNITSDKKEGIGTWSVKTIATYLKTGQAPGRGVVFGSMAQTVHDSLSKMTDADILAMATYIKTIPPKATYKEAKLTVASASPDGQTVYLNNCSSCHQTNGNGLGNAIPPLSGNGAVAAQGPQNVIRAVLGGLPAQGTYGPMPGFATLLTPQQIADVANYVRTTWANAAPATATADMVTQIAPDTKTEMAGDLPHWCTKPGTTPLDKAIESPAIESRLHAINPVNMLPDVNAIVASVKKAAPQAAQADIVNSLTAAYCPVVEADNSIPKARKPTALDQFSVLAYTQLTNNEKD
jgi:mono/diheme cytochrome c family protein